MPYEFDKYEFIIWLHVVNAIISMEFYLMQNQNGKNDLIQNHRLVLENISKSYPNVKANDSISLEVNYGEIHALLGENGAGKSTLMKILYGVTKPEHGNIYWEGRQVEINSPAIARGLGIGMIFQHFALFESLTVLENISLSIDKKCTLKELENEITKISEHYGLPINPRRMIHSMSVGERQRVEIVRCLLQNPKLIIMDEPTSVLTPQAIQVLFQTIRKLAEEGCSILYISHKMDEIKDLCDTATVLRAGKVTGKTNPKYETAQTLAKLMIGSELPKVEHHSSQTGQTMLEVIDLNFKTTDTFGVDLSNINLKVRAGEIIGIAGISGNGQKELIQAISGETILSDRNCIYMDGLPVANLGASNRRSLGFGFVPEDRLGRGAIPQLALSENALLTAYRQNMVSKGFIQTTVSEQFSDKIINEFNVVCSGYKALAGSLSGGNLQKFIVGREILLQPKLMLVAQPTWGVDVGASVLIRQSLLDLRRNGVAVLVVSEELEELMLISDQIAVIANGKLSQLIPTEKTSIEMIGLMMSGQFISE